MKATKNIARLAVTAGLAAALSFGGVMAPVTMAFAEDGSTVTFSDPDYATSTTYKGIQIFRAKVTKDNGATTASDIEWAGTGTEIQTAVVSAIKAKDKTYSSNNAQDAADWLNDHAGVSGTDSKVAGDNVLSVIAANLGGVSGWKTTTAGSPSLSGLDAGYWLFLTAAVDTSSDKSTDAFTSPVYAAIDGTSPTTVTPKKDVPTVEKKILDDNEAKDDPTTVPAGKWDDAADSQIGQEVHYKLTGSVASNYATYDSYAYKFTDVLSNGLDYVNGSVEVYAFDGTNYAKINTDKYDAKCVGKTLTVEFKVDGGKKGLKEVEGVTAGTQIVVFYKAKLNSNAVIGNSTNGSVGGNPNTVTLEYSNNPYGTGMGKTVEHTVADFAFKLKLKKVDQGTEKGLGGAVFTIQSADENTRGQYVASTTDEAKDVIAGQLVTVADPSNLPEYVKFTSSSDESNKGMIEVKGLDAGSYTVTEIATPDSNYKTAADPFTFTITPTYNESKTKVKNLTAVPGSEQGRTDIAFGELDGKAGDNVLHGQDGTGTNADTGEVTINVGNTKSVGLPLTGLNGVTFTWIAGGAVLCIGVAHLIRSRKRDEGSEE